MSLMATGLITSPCICGKCHSNISGTHGTCTVCGRNTCWDCWILYDEQGFACPNCFDAKKPMGLVERAFSEAGLFHVKDEKSNAGEMKQKKARNIGGTGGTITIICGGRKCTMWNESASQYSGLGLDLIRELKEILPHLDDWIYLWKKIEIVDKYTDPANLDNKYPGSLRAVIESSSLVHSDRNYAVFDYTIDFDEQEFGCDDHSCKFEQLDDLEKYYELGLKFCWTWDRE